MMPITAQHHGICPECEMPIVPGEAIARDEAGAAWQHDVCGSMPDSTTDCACSSCFLVHAGECF